MSDVVEENAEQSTIDEPHTTLPGKRLKQARELRNLEQTDIAKELKLDLRFVKALEEGRFNELPQPVYTAGYVRAYSKLVGLLPDEIVAEYTAYQKSSATTKNKSKAKSKEHIPSHYRQVQDTLPKSFSVGHAQNDDKRKFNLMLSVLAVAVVFAIAWQLSNKPVDTTATPSGAIPSDVKQPVPNESPSTGNPDPSELTIKNAAPGSSATPGTEGSPALQPESLAPASAPANTGLVKSSDHPGEITHPQNSDENIITQELKQNADNLTQLSIEFSHDSWVDIRDATGKPIIRKLGLAGGSSTVSGVAPFEVLLGYSPGVNIEFDGKPYDMSPYNNKRVVRFVLNEDSVGPQASDLGQEND